MTVDTHDWTQNKILMKILLRVVSKNNTKRLLFSQRSLLNWLKSSCITAYLQLANFCKYCYITQDQKSIEDRQKFNYIRLWPSLHRIWSNSVKGTCSKKVINLLYIYICTDIIGGHSLIRYNITHIWINTLRSLTET